MDFHRFCLQEKHGEAYRVMTARAFHWFVIVEGSALRGFPSTFLDLRIHPGGKGQIT